MADNSSLTIDILDSLPPEWGAELLPEIRNWITASSSKVVILDDDPTGTQTISNIPVLTHWSKDAILEELAGDYPAFFILTNSRSLPQPKACKLAQEIGANLQRASLQSGTELVVISRSDSTLRGHFPSEVDATAGAMGENDLPYLIIPFFLEGGRYTINDIHYVHEGRQLIPAAQTPFARDAAFAFYNSNLREWVAEKSEGVIRANEVQSISLDDIRRGGPDRVAEILSRVKKRKACIVNAASYSDMEVLVAGLLQAEEMGRKFLLRTAASFVRTRIGQGPKSGLLTKDQLVSGSSSGGLFIIGSYVEKTSLQVEELFSKTNITRVEVRVDQLLDAELRHNELQRVIHAASVALELGQDTAIYTSRKLVTGHDAVSSLEIGRVVSDSLIEISRNITVQPRYLVAKGGITSSDIATKGLSVRRAMVLGQALPGVPTWQLGKETRYPGMSYIVFPGNVGDVDALAVLKNSLQ